MAMQMGFSPEEVFHYSLPHITEYDNEVCEVNNIDVSCPIRDIWMKFELLTPPLSPCRDSSCASSPVFLSSSSVDTLQCVSDIIDGDNCRTFVELEHNCANLTSKLIQDCMWGSHSSQEKNSSKQVDNAYDTPCSSPPPFYPIDTVGAECVDPTSVFPHHIHTQDFPSSESSSGIKFSTRPLYFK